MNSSRNYSSDVTEKEKTEYVRRRRTGEDPEEQMERVDTESSTIDRDYWEPDFQEASDGKKSTSVRSARKRRPFRDFIRHMASRITRDHVTAYAAQSAFFLLLSFIPFMLLILQIIPFVPVTENQMTSSIVSVIPEEFQDSVRLVIQQLSEKSLAVFSVSAVILLWSAGKMIHSLTAGLNVIYRVKRKGFLFNRFRAMGYTLVLILVIILTLVLVVFSRPIRTGISLSFPSISSVTGLILDWGSVIMFFVLILAFSLIYSFVSNKFLKIWEQLIGAIFSAIGWEILAIIFSWLINLVPGFATMYGSMTMLLLIMIWVYWGLMIFFVGAELNHYIWLRNLTDKQRNQLFSLWRRFKGRIPVEMMATLVTAGRKKDLAVIEQENAETEEEEAKENSEKTEEE